jgi:hypothetical protein
VAKITPIVRTYPAGDPAAGEAYEVFLHLDDSSLDSGTLDVAGQFEYEVNGSPGPIYWEVTDATPTPDAIRVGSSTTSGSGGAYSLAELPIALRALGNGVIDGYGNELAVTDPDSGTNLAVATGAAIANGIPAVWHTSATHAITSSQDAANPKACYLVLEFTGLGEAEEGKVELVDTCGAAAASPSLPALTQTDATYQLPLATFQLGIVGASNADDVTAVTDARAFVGRTRNPVVSNIVRRTDPTSSATSTSTTGEDATSLTTTLTLLNGITYDLFAQALLLGKISSASETWQIAPYLNGTGNIATYVTGNNTSDYVALGNSYALAGVAGTGATVSCGLRIKVSGGTMTYITGFLLVWGIPRS